MPLTKGFLNRKVVIRPQRLITGIILWLLFSYILYAFFYLFRETLRIQTHELGGQMLLVLDEKEHFLYNLFYAATACALSYMFSLRFVLDKSVSKQPIRTRLSIRRTLNDQGFFTWSFLQWFGKLTTMLGIWYLVEPLQYDVNFLKEFPHLLMLIPVVTFLSTWPALSRAVRVNHFKWLGITSVIFVITSFGLAFKDFADYKRINQNLLKNTIRYSYKLELPKTQSFQRIERLSLVTDVYIVADSIEPSKPLIFFEDLNTKVTLKGVKSQLFKEREKFLGVERSMLTPNLYADEDIPIGFIKELEHQLRIADVYRIQYSTARKFSKYPPEHPRFKYYGIQQSLYPPYFPEFEAFLDSAEKLDLSNHAIRLPESIMFRINALKEYNRVELNVTENEVILNGKPVSKEKLEEILYSFIKKYSPDYVIILNTDDQLSYGKYIEYLDLIYTQVDRLRNQMSLQLHHKPFDDWYWGEEKDSIQSRYPRNIAEWTQEERRLMKLMERTN